MNSLQMLKAVSIGKAASAASDMGIVAVCDDKEKVWLGKNN